MNDWTEVPLEEIAVLKGGYAFKSGDYRASGCFVLRTLNIDANGNIDRSQAVYVDESLQQDLQRFELESWDTIFVMVGATLGKMGLMRPSDLPALLNQNMWVIRPLHGRVVARYLYYAFAHASQSILGWASGAAREFVRRDDFRKLQIALPSLSEQRAIAEVLGALDDKMEANQTVATRAEDLARSAVLVTSATIPVGDVATVGRKAVSTRFFANRDVEHFSIPAFDAGRLPIRESGDNIKSGKFLLEEPAVLVSKLNPRTPRVWMAVPRGTIPAVTSTEFVALHPAGDYPVEILWALCSSTVFSSELVQMVTGTTGSHQRVSPGDLLAVLIPDPRCLTLSTTETVTGAVRLAGAVRRESARLAALSDALLPRLLSGEVRVREVEQLVGEAV